MKSEKYRLVFLIFHFMIFHLRYDYKRNTRRGNRRVQRI